ncbi:MAG: LysM peptidoglycan-binding domain-containing protein [Planctomycetota bacterium]|nr:LysM peptidoglycan-binding domain-containing protein [Planctomycetota bacterium]
MTHETRIALLVGLVFIVLFGLVLGQRSISFSKSYNSSNNAEPDVLTASSPGPEVVSAVLCEQPDRSVLAPSAESSSPSASIPEPQRDESVASAPAASDIQPIPPAGVVSPPRQRTYQVRSGDTLIGIARKVYGRGHEDEHLRIYRANRDKLSSPATLSIGQVLVIPSPSSRTSRPQEVASSTPQKKHYTEMTLTALSSRFSNDRTYVVCSGDSLTDIARRTMGSGNKSAVQKLVDANRDRLADPDRLAVGMKLRIPG